MISCFMSFSAHEFYHVFTPQENLIKHKDPSIPIHTLVENEIGHLIDFENVFIYPVWKFIIDLFKKIIIIIIYAYITPPP